MLFCNLSGMGVLLCGVGLGGLLFLLVCGFHSFVWNVGESFSIGLRS